jgi:hypothetical protein
MASGDPWAVLGLAPGAPLEDARRAYLARLQLVHPDRHQGTSPAVLAEAERATRELNTAWEQVQALWAGGGVAGPGGGGPGPPPPPGAWPPSPPPGARGGPSPPPTDAAGCLQWAIDRLVDAGRREGQPLMPSEVELLRRPAAGAPGGRRLQRWLTRRRATLAVAVASDGPDAWATVVRVLLDDGPAVVLGLLFTS